MDIFVARQPIFSRQKKLVGYELLHRTTAINRCPVGDGDRATASLLANSFLTIGLDRLVGNRWAFINFTERHLVEGTAETLPSDKVIIEVLEHVPPTPEVIEGCRRLKQQGFRLALDDFVFTERVAPLVELADIIKIDFQALAVGDIERMRRQLGKKRVRFLAEKIESYQEFELAWKMGFNLFQGYFFRRPEVVKNRELVTSKLQVLPLLAEVNRQEINLNKIEELISQDVGLSYKLLRYINSAYYYLLSEVASIHHALVYLGEAGVRQFVSLVAVSELTADKPDELLRSAVIRARLCELMAERGPGSQDPGQLFLLGLFSLLEAMLDMSMDQVLDRLPLAEPVREALLGGDSPLTPYLRAVTAYERGDWLNCQSYLERLDIEPAEIARAYLDSVTWSEQFANAQTG